MKCSGVLRITLSGSTLRDTFWESTEVGTLSVRNIS